MRRKPRKWDEGSEDDPAAGLLNLFDVWIAFAVALLLAILSYEVLDRSSSGTTATMIKNEGTPEMEIIKRDGMKIERFRASPESLGGDGERLGTAYRLKSGEVIYVPERKAPGK
ncbi:hypothetical protein DES53_101411 [Roseimicrobium gellanilyticum]|uniref:DUF2149 domain-containing protein n=1 Tax=Roseimicrobium gellanilyticum TaxID=748857 RepID=A0A366HVM4_9BACT|nr:DUF2149 domain-containing protein [Roseimicrobium gellanilyticum]RBP47614.1 hypothetical protein DES53_101411 [Roseimicrobium gellanilyticum]